MEEKILKLIESYKFREAWLSKQIIELEKERRSEMELKLALNARLLWRVVIKDLEKTVRKDR